MLLGGVMLLHRFSPRDFERAKEVLESLTQRVPRHATPWAWLARWRQLKVFQGWSEDPTQDREAALALCGKALDIDPESSIALTTAGAVHGVLLKDLDRGIGYYKRAIESNPNEPLAWLLLGTAHSFRGEGEAAVQATEQALRLSPMDPMRFFYDVHAGAAAASAGQFERAIELAQRSLKANRLHVSTYRVLAIAQALSGQVDAARDTVSRWNVFSRVHQGPTTRSASVLPRHCAWRACRRAAVQRVHRAAEGGNDHLTNGRTA
jgi:tetratricopeptide (TPR) repeat protein